MADVLARTRSLAQAGWPCRIHRNLSLAARDDAEQPGLRPEHSDRPVSVRAEDRGAVAFEQADRAHGRMTVRASAAVKATSTWVELSSADPVISHLRETTSRIAIATERARGKWV